MPNPFVSKSEKSLFFSLRVPPAYLLESPRPPPPQLCPEKSIGLVFVGAFQKSPKLFAFLVCSSYNSLAPGYIYFFIMISYVQFNRRQIMVIFQLTQQGKNILPVVWVWG